MEILAWEGIGPFNWTRNIDGVQPAKLRSLCTIKADLSNLWPALTPYIGLQGQDYWRVDYKVVIRLDGLRIQAKLQWYEGVRSLLKFIRLLF